MHIIEDIRAYKRNDPAARSALEILLLYNGLHATIDYRIAHWLHRHGFRFLARAISQWSKMWTGIEIHPGARIGRRLVIDHGTGIVIGETAEIGDDCLLYQGVTLGGTGKDVGKRHPTLGNNVMVGSGAKVLEPFQVGDNARIAANSVVLREVPENATVVGVPGRIVRLSGEKLDHITQSLGMVAEGVKTTAAIHEMAQELQVEAPLTRAVYGILYKEMAPPTVLRDLMSTDLREE